MNKRIKIFLFVVLILFAILFLIFTKNKIIKQPSLNSRPNIIIIMTDQERYPTHWPNNWIENNLPSQARLKKYGMVFNKAYTSASECCPSRAVMVSGEYYPTNGVATTDPLIPLSTAIPTIGKVLSSQGYDVIWKGKWHLSNPVIEKNGDNNWSNLDIDNLQKLYGMSQWNPPDSGNIIDPPFLFSLGGGNANNDARYVDGTKNNSQTPGYGDSIIQYLTEKSNDNSKPFCLFISFANPHDVWVYPTYWREAGYKQEDFSNIGINIPDNFTDDLSKKPSIQTIYQKYFNELFPLQYELAKVEYVNFYAYLHKVIDKQIMKVLDTIDNLGFTGNSIIIRTADHGEAGLSHGLRQKAYSAYEEIIHIPLIISNPNLFSQTTNTDSFYCHADLFPTISDLAGIKNQIYKGNSIVPILKNPTLSVQDSILFTYDDVLPGLSTSIEGSHIRAIRKDNYMYAIYFAPASNKYEYEMYDISIDPGEINNLLFGNVQNDIKNIAAELDDNLRDKINEYNALPPNVTWPSNIWKN